MEILWPHIGPPENLGEFSPFQEAIIKIIHMSQRREAQRQNSLQNTEGNCHQPWQTKRSQRKYIGPEFKQQMCVCVSLLDTHHNHMVTLQQIMLVRKEMWEQHHRCADMLATRDKSLWWSWRWSLLRPEQSVLESLNTILESSFLFSGPVTILFQEK